MPRSLADVVADQRRVFADLLMAQEQLASLNQAGRQPGIVDGETSDVDIELAAVHAAQHQLDALAAEALQAAMDARS